MTQFINPFCQPTLEFNRDNAHRMNTLCAPLKQHFDITAYGYLRVMDDGRFLAVSNNQHWLDSIAKHDYCFRSKHFIDLTESLCKYDPLIALWPGHEHSEDEAIQLLGNHGLRNCLNIIKEKDGSVEAHFFATDKDHPLINNFYRHHLSALEDFIGYMQMVGSDICDPSNIAKLGISPNMLENYPRIEKIFKQTTPWERKILEFNDSLNSLLKQEIYELGRRYGLTIRELECLSYFTTGKTSKEIARLLDIAPRTVEAHLNNIRIKTDCQTKIELTHWFEETFKPFLVKPPFGGLAL